MAASTAPISGPATMIQKSGHALAEKRAGPKERAELWQMAIGLQKVDGLEISNYLVDTAKRHIEGEVNIDDVDKLITTYYQSEAAREIPDDVKQADEVSKNIVRILSEQSFSFSIQG